jgi:hypothetical protein
VGIRFAKSVIVTERTVIDIVYYSLVQNRNVLIVSRYGQDELKQDLSSFAIAGAWSHMLVKATDLGYTVGQEVTGIDLYLSENAGVIYIDEVLCFDMEELSNGVVSSFDYGYYASNLIAPGAEYSDTDLLKKEYYYYFRNSDPDYGIEKVQYGIDVNGYAGNRSGVLKVTYDKRGSIGIKFAKAETVTANTKVTVRLYYNDTSLYISRFGSDSLGVKNENLTANAWIDVTVSATELGYSVGETIDGLDLYFGEYDGVVYIDYITVTNN